MEIEYNLAGLEKLKRSLKSKYFVKLGVLGKKSARPNSEETNADIGAKHEFGVASENLAPRSFLRMPVMEKLPAMLKEVAKVTATNLLTGNLKKAYEKLGIAGEKVVQEAFETKGFGKWQDITEYTKMKKGSSQILIDTGQLRQSITSEVVSKV